jgi:hypothetical protein
MPPAPLTKRFGNFAGRTDGSPIRIVVVRLEIDGVLVDIAENFHRRLGQARFGVSIGRRRIAIDRAEISLAVDERHAHGKILRHPDHRIVDRLVAVRMIFTDHVADHARGLDVLLVGRVPLLVHRIQNAPMHRLQSVARIRQRPRHDHAHGVIEVGAFHLVEDGNGTRIRGRRRLPGGVIFGVGQGVFPVSSILESYSASVPRKPPPCGSGLWIFRSFFQILNHSLGTREGLPGWHLQALVARPERVGMPLILVWRLSLLANRIPP